ncbi:hypothetical protein LEMLEM_LOCUS14774 [Lemmus lemmus]|jgi:hypothetical protein
MAMT